MFKLAERPVLMPARTLIGSTVGPVVDTEVTIQSGGRVYLSEIEVGECAKFFPNTVATLATDLGWASPDTVAELEQTIADLREQLAEAEAGQPKMVALDDVETLLATR